MFVALLSLLLIGLAAVVVAGIALAIVGTFVAAVFGLAGFLLFKVAPLLLVGWLVVKLITRAQGNGPRRISEADRRWLDGE